MPRDRQFTESSRLVAVRLPARLRDQARWRARALDLTFSQLMRRAIRKEIGLRNDGAQSAVLEPGNY